METNEILARIEYGNGEFESEVVREAIRRPSDVAPVLLQILEDIVVDDESPIPEQYAAHLYAIHILAELRETDAHIPLLQLCLLPERRLKALFGNILDGELDRALAATSGGEISGIVLLIEDPGACEDVRIAGLRALVQLADSEDASRKGIIECLAGLVGSLVGAPSPVWAELVYGAQLLAAPNLGQEVLSAEAGDLGDDDESEEYTESEPGDSEDAF